jgi:hypothetical protein
VVYLTSAIVSILIDDRGIESFRSFNGNKAYSAIWIFAISCENDSSATGWLESQSASR